MMIMSTITSEAVENKADLDWPVAEADCGSWQEAAPNNRSNAMFERKSAQTLRSNMLFERRVWADLRSNIAFKQISARLQFARTQIITIITAIITIVRIFIIIILLRIISIITITTAIVTIMLTSSKAR